MGEPMLPGIRLEVTLLSGRGVALTAAADRVTVGQLKRWAEKQLAVGIAQLIYEDRILLDANLLEKESLKDGDLLIANIRAAQILAGKTCPAFFLVRGDGRVAVWGDMSLGVPRHLRELQQVVACKGAWAALMDGQVVVWGHPRLIPEKVVLEELKDVRQLCATEDALAALRHDGRVITWGCTKSGGDNCAVEEQLDSIEMLAGSVGAFLAIARDGRAITWGSLRHGAVAGGWLPPLLAPPRQVAATRNAFAVLQEDGAVVWWGRGSSRVSRSLVVNEIMDLCSSEDTFVALRKDGTVVTWQSASLMEMEGLSQVKQVVASRYAFAALKQDGTVKVWGHLRYGGDPCSIRKLRQVQELYASSAAFAALRADGSVWTWGDARYGGDGSPLAQQLSDVRRLCRFKRRFFETEE